MSQLLHARSSTPLFSRDWHSRVHLDKTPIRCNSLFEIDHRHFWMVWVGRIVLNVSVSTFSLFMISMNLGFKLTREGVSSVWAPRTSSGHQTLLKNGANLLNTKTVKFLNFWNSKLYNFVNSSCSFRWGLWMGGEDWCPRRAGRRRERQWSGKADTENGCVLKFIGHWIVIELLEFRSLSNRENISNSANSCSKFEFSSSQFERDFAGG